MAEEPHSTVVVVALPAAPAEFVVDGGLTADEMHVTLGFYGEAADIDADVLSALSAWVDGQNPVAITARVSGLARMGDDDPVAVTMLIEAQELGDLRAELGAVAEPDRTHPHFTPHITLGYGIDMPAGLPVADVVIDRIQLWIGGERTRPMPGSLRAHVELGEWLSSAQHRQSELVGRLG